MDKKQTGEKTFLQKRNERMIIDDFDRMNEETKIFEIVKLFISKIQEEQLIVCQYYLCKRVNVKILNDIRKEERKWCQFFINFTIDN